MNFKIGNKTPQEFTEGMIQELFVAPTEPPAAVVERYLNADYAQYTDGQIVGRDQQIAHLEFLHKNATLVEFDIQQVTYDGEWLAERHFGHVVFADGRDVRSEVATFFRIVDGRISEVHEVTRPLSDNDDDRSVHTAH